MTTEQATQLIDRMLGEERYATGLRLRRRYESLDCDICEEGFDLRNCTPGQLAPFIRSHSACLQRDILVSECNGLP